MEGHALLVGCVRRSRTRTQGSSASPAVVVVSVFIVGTALASTFVSIISRSFKCTPICFRRRPWTLETF